LACCLLSAIKQQVPLLGIVAVRLRQQFPKFCLTRNTMLQAAIFAKIFLSE
jgi:hypothetical protein